MPVPILLNMLQIDLLIFGGKRWSSLRKTAKRHELAIVHGAHC